MGVCSTPFAPLSESDNSVSSLSSPFSLLPLTFFASWDLIRLDLASDLVWRLVKVRVGREGRGCRRTRGVSNRTRDLVRGRGFGVAPGDDNLASGEDGGGVAGIGESVDCRRIRRFGDEGSGEIRRPV